MKHTKGNWELDSYMTSYTAILRADKTQIASITGNSLKEAAANAKLIAAAPDLLEAPIDCVERVELDMGANNSRVIKAKQAIKKATS